MTEESNKLSNLDKRKPKGPITFNIKLNEEQKEAKQIILDNPVTLIKGAAGSGKTLVACQIALDMFFKREVEKIIIARPMVEATNPMGFLPGSEKDKLLPWLLPIYSNLYMLYNKQKIEKMIEEGEIEILPLAYVRGRTYVNACIIVDESQNLTTEETEMVLGRMGLNSKIILCGDSQQIDLKNKKSSGIDFFKILEANVKGVKIITLKENHRHPIVAEILEVFREYN